MFLVGSTYWNMVYGKDIGDVLKDDEGMANMRILVKTWHGISSSYGNKDIMSI